MTGKSGEAPGQMEEESGALYQIRFLSLSLSLSLMEFVALREAQNCFRRRSEWASILTTTESGGCRTGRRQSLLPIGFYIVP